MNLYTSDLHFGHENVIRFDDRPFSDIEEMDRTLIEMWNARVRDEDTVYIVGDVCFRSKKPAAWYLKQLKGRKILIFGNHDIGLTNDQEALSFFEATDKMMHVSDQGEQICLCHYPLAEWNKYHRGSWHIYGHIHNRRDDTYHFMRNRDHALNAGCMINGYMPVSFRELVQNNIRFKSEDP